MNPANIQMLAQLLQRAAEALGSEHDAGRYDLSPLRLSEALRHRPHDVARVLVSAARAGKRREEIQDACQRHRVPFLVVPERAPRLAAVAVRVAAVAAVVGRPSA